MDHVPVDLGAFGADERVAAALLDAVAAGDAPEGAVLGRVVRHDGVAVVVATDSGTEQLPMRGTVPPLAVGDWVAVHDRAVSARLPRRAVVRRRDVDKDTEQILAANVDLVVAVCGLDRPVRQGRIQRVGLLAADAGVPFAVVLTKADLVDDADEIARQVAADEPGAQVLVCAPGATAGRDGDEQARLDAVAALLRDRTTVMVGESGAGKSTLTNALLGREAAATGEVRSGDAKGRHTTTSREMHVLPLGGVIVDSPGIRSVGVFVDEEALAEAFDDIDELALECRFSDCSHRVEPGCAVLAAVEAGVLDRDRLEAWRRFGSEDDDPPSARSRGRRDYGDPARPT